MSDLSSAELPPIGPDDHVRGSGPELIVFFDLACPACAASWAELLGLRLRTCFRHFPLGSKRPRSPALHAAAEAAGLQRPHAFWAMVDSIYADQGHQDDPHLWSRAREFGLELERFERERRSEDVAARVRSDFEAGIRAGVSGTPTAFFEGRMIYGAIAAQLIDREHPL